MQDGAGAAGEQSLEAYALAYAGGPVGQFTKPVAVLVEAKGSLSRAPAALQYC